MVQTKKNWVSIDRKKRKNQIQMQIEFEFEFLLRFQKEKYLRRKFSIEIFGI